MVNLWHVIDINAKFPVESKEFYLLQPFLCSGECILENKEFLSRWYSKSKEKKLQNLTNLNLCQVKFCSYSIFMPTIKHESAWQVFFFKLQ